MAHANDKKIEFERYLLNIAVPVLKKIYGDFKIDESQKDKPDAAIILKNNKRVGIEIITAEPEEVKKSLNGTKSATKLAAEKFFKEGHNSVLVNRVDVNHNEEYILIAAKNKIGKYQAYKSTNKFDEIILIVASNFLNTRYEYFKKCHIPITQSKLYEAKFPYNKLIYVYFQNNPKFDEAILIYDKNEKYNLNLPSINNQKCKEMSTQAISFIVRVGQTVNVHEIAEKKSTQDEVNEKRKKRKNKKQKTKEKE
ncbi:hypothetical protein [Gilliamella sp. Occ4-3]|uniref:hypothetical protein n=1 Tax=Gilliamella sp. Occ4-3 TaxID=3120254 RepID=UPI00080E0A6B|nr:hypothetical protein [Gilliamella apicola]OCG79623.1 hypothetical protein A9G44_10765 [Gilliamella apicola]